VNLSEVFGASVRTLFCGEERNRPVALSLSWTHTGRRQLTDSIDRQQVLGEIVKRLPSGIAVRPAAISCGTKLQLKDRVNLPVVTFPMERKVPAP
jgi:hypothetical protein